jgi:hypothetical protein
MPEAEKQLPASHLEDKNCQSVNDSTLERLNYQAEAKPKQTIA